MIMSRKEFSYSVHPIDKPTFKRVDKSIMNVAKNADKLLDKGISFRIAEKEKKMAESTRVLLYNAEPLITYIAFERQSEFTGKPKTDNTKNYILDSLSMLDRHGNTIFSLTFTDHNSMVIIEPDDFPEETPAFIRKHVKQLSADASSIENDIKDSLDACKNDTLKISNISK